MIHARDHELIVWEGQVYRRVGPVADVDLGADEPTGCVATERLTLGTQTVEKGEELTTGDPLPFGAQRFQISIAIPRRLDVDRLVERGLAKRKVLRRRSKA